MKNKNVQVTGSSDNDEHINLNSDISRRTAMFSTIFSAACLALGGCQPTKLSIPTADGKTTQIDVSELSTNSMKVQEFRKLIAQKMVLVENLDIKSIAETHDGRIVYLTNKKTIISTGAGRIQVLEIKSWWIVTMTEDEGEWELGIAQPVEHSE